MNRFRFLSLAGWLCMAAASLGAADAGSAAYPLWDGKEAAARYARRVNLPETRTLDLGNGVALELVLIPAGTFILGTPKPSIVDEATFQQKVMVGQAVLAAGGGILLVLIGFSILRAIRERRRFQYSLRRFMAMTLAAGICVLGGMHWWHSERSLEDAYAEYCAAMIRFRGVRYEKSAQEVTITKPFYMGKYEVTQEQYQRIMGANPSHFSGSNLPVEMVYWDNAKEFCRKAGMILSHDRKGGFGPLANARGLEFRLPTEAEWEYACRAGTVTVYYSGDKETDLARAAWYAANSGDATHPVGQKEPNAWGLYDMHGNVREWCEDWFEVHLKDEARAELRGPLTQGKDSVRCIVRGGSWAHNDWDCRSAGRDENVPDIGFSFLGFRVVLAGPP